MEKTIRILTNTLIGVCLLFGAISANAASLTVTTTADAGIGSLRQAIIDATINAEANMVTFNVPMTDPGYHLADNRFTIQLLSALPDLPLAPITPGTERLRPLTSSECAIHRVRLGGGAAPDNAINRAL